MLNLWRGLSFRLRRRSVSSYPTFSQALRQYVDKACAREDQRQKLVQNREYPVVEPGLPSSTHFMLSQPVAEASDNTTGEAAFDVCEQRSEEEGLDGPEHRRNGEPLSGG